MIEIPTFWWSHVRNFGDAIAPLLLTYFANVEAVWSPANQSRLVCTGSILEALPKEWDGIIIGTGKLHNKPVLLPKATVLALRGPLTAMDFHGDFALGDAGLLADELVNVKTRNYDLGIVPHWSDMKLAANPEFARYKPLIIDPRGDPLCIIQMIGQCHKIVSSSLHGIVLADAFGIPRRFEYTPRFDQEGGLFKFQDYSAAISTPLKVGVTQLANRFSVENRRNELSDAFRTLSRLVS